MIEGVETILKSRNLKSNQRFLELKNLDQAIRKYFPSIIDSPELLLMRDKNEFKTALEEKMGKRLNGAESSVVNNFYDVLNRINKNAMIDSLNAKEQGNNNSVFQIIVQKINRIANRNNHRISNLMQLRKELGKITIVQGRDIFGFNSNRGNYTFHKGGNKELQFNFGEDDRWFKNKRVFRYGVAFSIERNPHFFNPEEVFQSKVEIFNSFLSANKQYFDNYSMYINRISKNEAIGFRTVQKINLEDTFPNTFIFIGKYLDKVITEITDSDIELMLESFDHLLTLYKVVESGQQLESRIARICWNTNGWVKPSGRLGKAPTDSHEKRHGFGHEEWLFDTSRVIDGYQYGFLEPIRKFQAKYQNKKFNLLLYTRDAVSEQKFWVGQLNNVEVISEKVAAEVIKKFNKTGLLEIMKSQLDEVGLDGRKLENEYLKEMDIINIRFRKEEIQNIFEKLIPIDSNEKRITSLYYVLLPWDGISSIKQIGDEDYFKTGNSGNGKLKSTAQASYKSSTKEIELTHNLISDSFLEYLKKEHGVNNVKRECRVTGNNRVDIVVRKNNKDIFYEIKTYPHLITSLRYALGQLIEYSCYPDKKRASQYYLVSNIEADQKFEDYITHLNKLFGFNLGYICFDIESESIIQKI